MVIRKWETFEPVTLGHIRSHGCRDLLVYCGSGRCHHNAAMKRGLAARCDAGALTLPADGVHAVWHNRRRRAPGLVAAHQQAIPLIFRFIATSQQSRSW
jgi:hypothetical protein